jgi:hypothetical protein
MAKIDVDDVPDIDPSFINKPAEVIYTPGPTYEGSVHTITASGLFSSVMSLVLC